MMHTASSSPSSTTSPYDLARLARWIQVGGGDALDRAIDALSVYGPDLGNALFSGNPRRISSTCDHITTPFTFQLDSLLPTPDAELTSVLKTLVDDAVEVEQACAVAEQYPKDDSVGQAVMDALQTFSDDLGPAESVMGRKGRELTAAGY